VSVVRRARVLKGEAVRGARPLVLLPVVSEKARRRIAKEAVDASALAKRLVDDARREAQAILEGARAEAARDAADTVREARESEVAKLAAMFLALRVEDERRAERDLDRAVGLARVLAERLLGEALLADPARVVALARQALLEARGASRAVIEASPLDAETLRSHVVDIGVAEGALEIKIDPSLSRGSLRVHTNLGSLDAQLTPQLERLAKALRDALA
jgi:flagellar biosynthesis/type III secretory pathway protein FliH